MAHVIRLAKPNKDVFSDPVSGISLNQQNPQETVAVITPEIYKKLQSGLLIDVGGTLNLQENDNINDSESDVTSTWSSHKVEVEIGKKADLNHTHIQLHTHANKASLDRFNINAQGRITIDGVEYGGGGGGAGINDGVTGSFSTWSSDKISEQILGRAAVSHIHSINNISNLQATLNGKAPLVHGHFIADVSGLQTALNAKAAVGHSHAELHVHANKVSLDRIGINGNSRLTIDGIERDGDIDGGEF